MTDTSAPPSHALRDGFAELVEIHARELRAHCYRMTGSFTDAEDLTQETFLRAWRGLDGFEARASPRTWLYRIATNACLDFLKSHQRRALPTDSISEALEREAWISPYPDSHDPARLVEAEDTTSLHLTAALAHLPSRQRAAFISRDLLGFDTTETASILDCSVTAVYSLLQRAHTRLQQLPTSPDDLAGVPTSDHEELVGSYVEAHHRGDVDAIVELLATDVRISMPPEAPVVGAQAAKGFYSHLFSAEGPGDWHLLPVRANGSPAIANYTRSPGEASFRALSIDVLDIHDNRISSIHCFLGSHHFPAFWLNLTTPAASRSDM